MVLMWNNEIIIKKNMKNTYLIKDVVHEKNKDRVYQLHKNKLKEILS